MKFEAIFVKVCFFMQNFCLTTFALCFRTFLDFLCDLFTLLLFLSNLSCSRSQLMFVVKSDCERKECEAIVAAWLRCQTADWEVSGSDP